jgi:hypothetical protein
MKSRSIPEIDLEGASMSSVQPSSWKIGKLFIGSFGRGNPKVSGRTQDNETVVRLIHSPRRVSLTPTQQRLISALKKTGSVSFTSLVHAVSDDLYAEELRMGGALLDLGLFGSRLFHNDVIQELRAGDGILWQINNERDCAR